MITNLGFQSRRKKGIQRVRMTTDNDDCYSHDTIVDTGGQRHKHGDDYLDWTEIWPKKPETNRPPTWNQPYRPTSSPIRSRPPSLLPWLRSRRRLSPATPPPSAHDAQQLQFQATTTVAQRCGRKRTPGLLLAPNKQLYGTTVSKCSQANSSSGKTSEPLPEQLVEFVEKTDANV